MKKKKLYQAGGNIYAFSPISAKTDTTFQKWYSSNTLEGKRGIPFSDKLDYDYYSFYKNNGVGDIKNHFPDTYKRPNHPTFSDESIYSVPENPGGHWQGEKFIPRKQTGGVFTSQAEIDQANAYARSLATRKGLVPGEYSYVAKNIGDPKPTLTVPSGMTAPTKQKLFTVPNYVQREDIQTYEGTAWYNDPQTGDIVDIDPSVLNQPRFKKTDAQVTQDFAKFQPGAQQPRLQRGGYFPLIDRGLTQQAYQASDLSVHQGQPRGTPTFGPKPPQPQYQRQFNPFQPSAAGLGIMAAYLGTSQLLNNANDKHYQEYKNRWIRDYSMPSLIRDPNKFSSEYYESPIYKDGGWIAGAVNPDHKGYCTPMSKSTCTPQRKAFARRAKAHFKQDGGLTMNTPQDQAMGYYGYPNASSLTFPGQGQRTFVPGPFPLAVKDDNGVQIMTNKPIKTRGRVTETPIYEQGGEVKHAPKVKRADATIEAEKGELILGAGAPGNVEDQEDRVGLGLYKIGGNKHYDGGTPLKASAGDFVFSNDKNLASSEDEAKKLTGDKVTKKKLRTPAALANKYISLNSHIKDAQDKELDPITKKTAILNINNFVDRLAEIAYAQEEKKGFPTGIPAFAQASLSNKFDPQGLQDQLNQFKYGGEVRKYQRGNVVPDDIEAEQVTKVPKGYTYYGTQGNRTYYKTVDGRIVQLPNATPGGTPGSAWEKSIIARLQSGVSPEELMQKKYIGPEGAKKYGKYYQPAGENKFVYTADGGPDMKPRYPNLDGTPPTPHYKPMTFDQNTSATPGDQPFDQYVSQPNSRFNINTAEAVGLAAALRPSKSRYPTAFRNYEIGNAKNLIASSSRPISEQPYLNAINRSTLGRDDLGSFTASLNAQNQAISQVYSQNLAREDAKNNALAQLEVQDGVDRVTQASTYDSKLEMLANNKELEAKDRWRNGSNMLNAMQYQREAKTLFNTMSDYYNIMPNGSMGFKPTYKIVDGKLQPYVRNMADLIRSTPSASQQYNPTIQLVDKLRGMGFDDQTIGRMVSRTWDDYDRQPRQNP